MSADAFVFHSSEADAPARIPPGWYIGFADGSGTLTTDGAIGPYPDEPDALEDIRSGAYLRTCTAQRRARDEQRKADATASWDSWRNSAN